MDRTNRSTAKRGRVISWVMVALLGSALLAPTASADPGDCIGAPLGCGVSDVLPGGLDLPDVLPDVPELPDVPVPDVPEIEVPDIELPSVPEVSEVPEVPEAPEVPEGGELPTEPELPPVEPELPELSVQGPGVPTNDLTGSSGKGGGATSAIPQTPSLDRDSQPVYPTLFGGLKAKTTGGSGAGDSNKVKARSLQAVPKQLSASAGSSQPSGAVPSSVAATSDTPETASATGFRPPTPADVLRFVGATAERFAFPLALALAVGIFLVIERRIDRRDPKLAAAPLTAELETFE